MKLPIFYNSNFKIKKNYENKPIYSFLVLIAYYNGIKKPSKVVL